MTESELQQLLEGLIEEGESEVVDQKHSYIKMRGFHDKDNQDRILMIC